MSNFISTGDDTSDRFSLLDMDGGPTKHASGPAPMTQRQPIPVIKTAPVAATAPAPATAPATGETASSTVRELATKEHELAKSMGIEGLGSVDDGLLFAAGTQLWDVGQENLRAADEQYKALPTLREVAATHAATIAAEDRKTNVTNLANWRIDGCGKLRSIESDPAGVVFGKSAIDMSENAVSQLRSYYPHGRARTLAERGLREVACVGLDGKPSTQIEPYPAGLALPAAPTNANAWLGDVKTPNRLRARTHRGRREVFSVHSVSKRGYVEFDTDRLLSEAAKVAGDLRCELTYDADSTRVRARCVAQAPIDIPAFNGVGRVHRVGFDLCSADDGSMSLQVGSFLIRVRCKNASLVTNEGKRSRFRHVGTFAKLREAMEGALTAATDAIDEMRSLWARAATEHFLDSESGAQLSATEAIERLVRGEYLPTGGLDADAAIAAYVAAWRAEESPHSAQGVIMAIQRAAHESSWSTRWAQDEIEETASSMLYQTVYTLDAPADEGATIEA